MSPTIDTTAPAEAIHLDAGGRLVQVIVVSLLMGVAGAAFTVALPGMLWMAAERIHLPHNIAFALPLAIDGGMLTAGVVAAVRSSQLHGATWLERLRKTWRELGLMAMLVAVSITAQTEHVVTEQGGWSSETWVAVIVAGAAPMTLLLTTEIALSVVLVAPAAPGRRQPAKRTVPAAEPMALVLASAPKPAPRTARPQTAPAIEPGAMSLDDAVAATVAGTLSLRGAAAASGATVGVVRNRVHKARAAQTSEPVSA